ncbi:MAG: DUF1292 domain-containing protein [Ruminococcaceae bacterium]|nr:DUF1292 domain-containing protein [Oscillospiraceae bacterium]
MSEDMNNTFLDEEEGIIELEDEDGNVTRFEFVDAMEYNGVTYYALVPESDDDEGADQFVVLKEEEVNGEAMLATVDDDDEYSTVGEMFLQRFAELAGYDEDDEEDGE